VGKWRMELPTFKHFSRAAAEARSLRWLGWYHAQGRHVSALLIQIAFSTRGQTTFRDPRGDTSPFWRRGCVCKTVSTEGLIALSTRDSHACYLHQPSPPALCCTLRHCGSVTHSGWEAPTPAL